MRCVAPLRRCHHQGTGMQAHGLAPASEGTDCWPLIPIRPHIGTTMTALLAPHTRAKRWHSSGITIAADIKQALMMAVSPEAVDIKRADAIGAHVAERHRCWS
jgi:hypothetical protein